MAMFVNKAIVLLEPVVMIVLWIVFHWHVIKCVLEA